MNAAASALMGRVTGETSLGKYTGGGPPSRDAVARRAFELYEKRGREEGHDVEDWLMAEREFARHWQ